MCPVLLLPLWACLDLAAQQLPGGCPRPAEPSSGGLAHWGCPTGQACVLSVLTCGVSWTWASSAQHPSARGPAPASSPEVSSVPSVLGEGVAVHSCCVSGTQGRGVSAPPLCNFRVWDGPAPSCSALVGRLSPASCVPRSAFVGFLFSFFFLF